MFVLCSFDLKFFVTYEYPGKKSKQNYKVITDRTFEIRGSNLVRKCLAKQTEINNTLIKNNLKTEKK